MKKIQGKNTKKVFNSKIKNGLLLSVVLLSIISAYFLGGHKSSVGSDSSFGLLNPLRTFIKQEDLIVNFQPLRDILTENYENDSHVSVYFEYLPTGSSIAINKDIKFFPASLLKVPVAMAVAKKVERGEWKWTNELVLMSTDKDNRFGDLYTKPSYSTFTIEELVRRSLSDSDNTAHFILVRNLEIDEMKDVYDHMGLEGFMHSEGSLSAKEYSIIFRALYSASYLNDNDSQKLLSYLSQSAFDEYAKQGLPQDIVFSHKIGVDVDKSIFLDSGIVYAENRSYILTVMTSSKNELSAQKIMADVSEKVYNYVKNYEE